MTDLNRTLNEREDRYGLFTDHARLSQDLKQFIFEHVGKRWFEMAPDQREALEMICHKLARIVNGDPNYADSWRDIAGYAMLVADRLEGTER
jgi:hypothetical protein